MVWGFLPVQWYMAIEHLKYGNSKLRYSLSSRTVQKKRWNMSILKILITCQNNISIFWVKWNILFKLMSSLSFHFFNMAIIKFKIACTTPVCGLRYISVGQCWSKRTLLESSTYMEAVRWNFGKGVFKRRKGFLRKTQLACTFCFTSHFLPEMLEVLAPIIGP